MPKKQNSGLYRTKVRVGYDASGKPIDKYVSGKTKKELEAARKQIIEYYIDGTAAAEDRLFGDYAVEWYHVRKEPFLSVSSKEAYRTALNTHILPVFGERNLRAITPLELQRFMNGFSGVSQTKITMIAAVLKGVFTSACVDRILESNPTANLVKPAAKPAAEKIALTQDERSRLETVCRTHPEGAYLAAMYYLGVRPGEARGLQWGDFDWTRNTVHIQRDIDYKAGGIAGKVKTASSDRIIPVVQPLRDILWPLRGLPSVYCFTGPVSPSSPLSKSSAERMWIRLMTAADMVIPQEDASSTDLRSAYVPKITPHTLRHNFVTMCWENGFDPYTTMRIAGHSSIKTTLDIYTHLSQSQFEKAANQMGEMFSRESKSCTKVAQTPIR